MWRKISLTLMIIILVSIPVLAETPPGCTTAEQYPRCEPCWTTCLYALMAEAWNDGTWDWDW